MNIVLIVILMEVVAFVFGWIMHKALNGEETSGTMFVIEEEEMKGLYLEWDSQEKYDQAFEQKHVRFNVKR